MTEICTREGYRLIRVREDYVVETIGVTKSVVGRNRERTRDL